MGRSSILAVSLVLSVDYGFRICTYISMARYVLQATMCRLTFGPDEHSKHVWEDMYKKTSYIVPVVILVLALPMAIMTTVNTLKYYARVLFVMTGFAFLLCMIAGLVIE